MSEALLKLKPTLDALTAEERASIRGYLDELEEIPADEWEAEWLAEVERREADVDAGRSKLVSWEEIKRGWEERRK